MILSKKTNNLFQDVHQRVIEATCLSKDFKVKNKTRSLKHILLIKEIIYMKNFDDRLGITLSFLIQERESEN